MSGVYIRGMEMPKNCVECWFRKTARHECLSDCQICPFTGETTPYTKRKDNCSLVPVPPHGRLIDADALIKELSIDDADEPNGATLLMAVFLEVLKAAPTIIPAEGG